MNSLSLWHPKRTRSWFSRALPLLLLLAVFSSQLLTLQHDHEGDLSHHTDCVVCLKLKTGSDFLASASALPEVVKHASDIDSSLPALAAADVPAANSRAPPL